MTVTLSPKPNSYSPMRASSASDGVPTLFAVYIRTKGKRTYERVALTANYVEALQARRLAGPGGDSLDIRVDAGGDPPMSFPSTQRDEFKRRYEALRADARLVDAAAIIDQIPVGEDVQCGLDDGLAFALLRIWNERRADEGYAHISYSITLFAGEPATYQFNTMKRR